MEYEHKGIKIAFDAERAEFSARIAGQMVRLKSLASMKGKIDKAETFRQFDAYVQAGWRDGAKTDYIKVRVVGIEKAKGKASWQNSAQWMTEGKGTHRSVYTCTDENLAALRARDKLREAHDAELTALKEAHGVADKAALAAISILRPE